VANTPAASPASTTSARSVSEGPSNALRVAVIGASGGIGAALVGALAKRDDVATIHATHHRSPAAGSKASVGAYAEHCELHHHALDATDAVAVEGFMAAVGEIDWLINCVGMLHDGEHGPEKSIGQFESEHFLRSMEINCLPTLLLGKHAARALGKSERGVFATVSARVGSITDNGLGGWYSYRASKAALNMSLKCLAIEWGRTRKRLRVAALHPGTTDTSLSAPFQANVPAGKLFSPSQTASYLLARIDALHDGPSGRFLAWDGEEIPW